MCNRCWWQGRSGSGSTRSTARRWSEDTPRPTAPPQPQAQPPQPASRACLAQSAQHIALCVCKCMRGAGCCRRAWGWVVFDGCGEFYEIMQRLLRVAPALRAHVRHASFYDDRVLDYVKMTPKRVAFQDMLVGGRGDLSAAPSLPYLLKNNKIHVSNKFVSFNFIRVLRTLPARLARLLMRVCRHWPMTLAAGTGSAAGPGSDGGGRSYCLRTQPARVAAHPLCAPHPRDAPPALLYADIHTLAKSNYLDGLAGVLLNGDMQQVYQFAHQSFSDLISMRPITTIEHERAFTQYLPGTPLSTQSHIRSMHPSTQPSIDPHLGRAPCQRHAAAPRPCRQEPAIPEPGRPTQGKN